MLQKTEGFTPRAKLDYKRQPYETALCVDSTDQERSVQSFEPVCGWPPIAEFGWSQRPPAADCSC